MESHRFGDEQSSFSFENGTTERGVQRQKSIPLHSQKTTLESQALHAHFLSGKKDLKLLTTCLEEEETRSVTRRDTTKAQLQLGDLSAPQLNYLNTNNNLFDLGSSSLLVDQGVRPSGLLASGDRFIPYRPEDTPSQGIQKFYHEENLLLSMQAKK